MGLISEYISKNLSANDLENELLRLIGEYNKLDYALLPIGDNYVMGPEDGVRAALMLQAKLTIPMHYNTFPVIAQDPVAFVSELQKVSLKGQVMKPGQSIEF